MRPVRLSLTNSPSIFFLATPSGQRETLLLLHSSANLLKLFRSVDFNKPVLGPSCSDVANHLGFWLPETVKMESEEVERNGKGSKAEGNTTEEVKMEEKDTVKVERE
jgi:hypothetical protein